MQNWLGQDIQIGDHVYKGARSGNISDFRIGEVIDLREKPSTRYSTLKSLDIDGEERPEREVQVRWLYRHGGIWKRYPWEDRSSVMMHGAVKAYEQRPGWNELDSLVKVDISNIKVVPDGQILQ